MGLEFRLILGSICAMMMTYSWLKADDVVVLNVFDGLRFYAMGMFYMVLALLQIRPYAKEFLGPRIKYWTELKNALLNDSRRKTWRK